MCERPCLHLRRDGKCALGPDAPCLWGPPMSQEEIRQAWAVIEADAPFHRRGAPALIEVRHPSAESGTFLGRYRTSFVRDDA